MSMAAALRTVVDRAAARFRPAPAPAIRPTDDPDVLMEVVDLKTYFRTEQGLVKAVDGVSFTVRRGGTLGIVGESGCGKSVTVRSLMQLVPQPPGFLAGGRIFYHRGPGDVVDITALGSQGREIRGLRGNDLTMIFQEPMTSLSPIYTIGDQIMEAVMLHQGLGRKTARDKAVDMLRRVNIAAPEKRVDEYQHQISGGMRQRAMIAMALSCNPRLLIADEPTTALDVTIEAQILALIKDMQLAEGSSLIIITHDLGVIAEMADQVIVMYVGKVVESGSTREVLEDPRHPYTRALLQSIPRIGSRERLKPISGSVPNLYALPEGCVFAPRCPRAMDLCRAEDPPEFSIAAGRRVKCWLHRDEATGAT